jgi:hypothetical protein
MFYISEFKLNVFDESEIYPTVGGLEKSIILSLKNQLEASLSSAIDLIIDEIWHFWEDA